MRKIKEIGMCPNCECSLTIFKTNSYKRFVKCEACGMSYALPKRGKISNSAIRCPRSNFPILIVERPQQKAYFWADQPCFSCIQFDKCETVKELENEFKELEVYGY
jgi:ribosomal protein S27E